MAKLAGSRPAAAATAAALVLLLSGCAVGPDFVASAAPDVNGYTKENLGGTAGRPGRAGLRSVSSRIWIFPANGGLCSTPGR